MDSELSLTQSLKRLEKLIGSLSPVRRLNTLTAEQQDIMAQVRDYSSQVRAQVEFSLADEDEAAARAGLRLAVEQLQAVREGLLAAGMHGLLGAADISQFTSLADWCIDRIQGILRS